MKNVFCLLVPAVALGAFSWPALSADDTKEPFTAANVFKITPHPDWKNALRKDGEPRPFRFGSLAHPARILIPREADAFERKAARDLQFWIGQVLAFDLPIVEEGGTLEKGAPEISVGRTKLLAEAGLSDPLLADEGYRIDLRGETLFLQGGKLRGPIFAVYALLEEDLGLRWYPRFGDGERTVTLSVPAGLKSAEPVEIVPRRFDPPFAFRSVYLFDSLKDYEVAYLNRLNSTGHYPVSYGPSFWFPPDYFVHTYARFVPPDTYFAKHPEYFAWIDGKRDPRQICPMNPEVRKLIVAKADLLLSEDRVNSISISPNDHKELCDCPECHRINQANQSTGAANLDLTNHVAEALAGKHPKANFWTLAYWGTIDCPTQIRPRDNVVIFLCDDKHSPLYPFHFIPQTGAFEKIAEAWIKATNRIFVWEYVANFSHYLLPFPNLEAVAENMRWLRDRGVGGGVMLQGNFQARGGERAELRTWLWSKQLWNPAWTTEDLERDFCYAYYGAAAPQMERYHALLRDKGRLLQKEKVVPNDGTGDINDLTVSAHFHPDVFWMDDALLKGLEQQIAEAELAAAGNDELLRRVRLAVLPVLYARLGQYLGYQLKYGEVIPGQYDKQTAAQRKIERANYTRMFARFAEIAETNEVDFLAEWTSANRKGRLDRWKRILERDALKAEFLELAGWKAKADETGSPIGWEVDVSVTPDFDKRGKLVLLLGGLGGAPEIRIDGGAAKAELLDPNSSTYAVDVRKLIEPGQTVRVIVRAEDSKENAEFPGWATLVSFDGDPAPADLEAARTASGNR